MKKSSLIEYTAYLLARILGAIVISLPGKINFIIGKFIGILGYYLLKKKRRLVLKNLKLAFGRKLEPQELDKIARKAFVSLALDIIETLYMPRIDFKYINKHVRIENLRYLDDCLKEGKGVILLAYHLGNWELANITCGLQGYTYKVIVNEQRYPLLNNLLNRYRESKGCKTIPRGVALREVLKALRNNEVVAMVGDQGGKDGSLSNLFGLPTSTPIGFVRFAQSTGAHIIPAIIVRERRFSHRITLESPLKPESYSKREDAENSPQALENYLMQSNVILERYISQYPEEYFWFYKIWKYSPVRTVAVLYDGKVGHLRQAEAMLKIVYRLPLPFTIYRNNIEISFKNIFAKAAAQVCALLAVDVWKFCLTKESYLAFKKAHADLIISCGSHLAGLNLVLARENLAKSICIMNPGIAGTYKFDLVVMPKHDNPPRKKNIAVINGALNLVDEDYLREHAQKLRGAIGGIGHKACIGLLIGGDTKKYTLTLKLMQQVIRELKKAASDLDGDILVTTSRRTSKKIETLLKEEFRDFSGCKLLVIANEKNIPEAVGGILGLADFILVSGESISMVSEAAASGKYTGVFRLKLGPLNAKTRHEVFLKNLESQGYIYIIETSNIASKIKDILENRPVIKKLNDRILVEEAIKKLL